jgi:hypothetical protein
VLVLVLHLSESRQCSHGAAGDTYCYAMLAKALFLLLQSIGMAYYLLDTSNYNNALLNSPL